jgi:hypothetical protein
VSEASIGANTERANAQFTNGVLEIAIPVAEQKYSPSDPDRIEVTKHQRQQLHAVAGFGEPAPARQISENGPGPEYFEKNDGYREAQQPSFCVGEGSSTPKERGDVCPNDDLVRWFKDQLARPLWRRVHSVQPQCKSWRARLEQNATSLKQNPGII